MESAEVELVRTVAEATAALHRQTGDAFRMVYEAEVAAHEETKARLQVALDRLALIEERADWLLGLPANPVLP